MSWGKALAVLLLFVQIIASSANNKKTTQQVKRGNFVQKVVPGIKTGKALTWAVPLIKDSKQPTRSPPLGPLALADTKRKPTDPNWNKCKPSERDCLGICFGPAKKDWCGTCNGHNASCIDCLGVVRGTAVKDCKNVCNGPHVLDNTEPQQQCCKGVDLGCDGYCFSGKKADKCGVCEGNDVCVGQSLDHCGAGGRWRVDQCGVCHGDNSCLDCMEVPWGTAKEDLCDVCGGTNACLDCDGVPNGNKIPDKCGVCGGNNTRCVGCDGVPASGLTWDPCWICGGDGSSCCGPRGGCSGHGTCDSAIKGCFCDYGWTGPLCQAKSNKCRTGDHQCNGKGRCDPDTGGCVCQEQWSGENCEWFMCSGHGPFDPANQMCTCDPGYTGLDCSICEAPETGHAFVCVEDHVYLHDPSHNSRYMQANLAQTTDADGNKLSTRSGDSVSALTPYQRAQLLDKLYGTKSGNETIARRNMEKWSVAQSTQQNMVSDWTTNSITDNTLSMLGYQMASSAAVSFTRISVPIVQVDAYLAGEAKLTKVDFNLIGPIPDVVTILPGGTDKTYVYGCGCEVATPVGPQVNMTFGTEVADAVDQAKELLKNADAVIDKLADTPKKSRYAKFNKKKETPVEELDMERIAKAVENVPVKKLFTLTKKGRLTATSKRLVYTKFQEPTVYADSNNLPLELANMYRKQVLSNRDHATVVGRMIEESSPTNTFTRSFPYWFFPIVYAITAVAVIFGLAAIFAVRRQLGVFE